LFIATCIEKQCTRKLGELQFYSKKDTLASIKIFGGLGSF